MAQEPEAELDEQTEDPRERLDPEQRARREAAVRAVAAAVEAAARDRSLREVAFSVDVDPQ